MLRVPSDQRPLLGVQARGVPEARRVDDPGPLRPSGQALPCVQFSFLSPLLAASETGQVCHLGGRNCSFSFFLS